MKYFPPPQKKAFLHHRSRSSEPGHPTDPLSRGEERSLSCNTPKRPASHKSHVCGGRKKKQQLNLHPRRSRCPSALSAPTHYPFFRRRASVPHVAARSSPPQFSVLLSPALERLQTRPLPRARHCRYARHHRHHPHARGVVGWQTDVMARREARAARIGQRKERKEPLRKKNRRQDLLRIGTPPEHTTLRIRHAYVAVRSGVEVSEHPPLPPSLAATSAARA